MDNEPKTTPENNSAADNSQINQSAPINQNAPKKMSPWVWVLGGCATIIVLSLAIMIFLGWWGFNKAKDEINKQKPSIEKFQQDLEKAAKDAEEFNQKAQEFQESMPNPEDLPYPMPTTEEEPVLN